MTTPTKPDLGNGLSHPARFPDSIIPVFATALEGYHRVLDPFAGTGKIHMLADLGEFHTVGVEIEPEWATLHERTVVGNALELPFDSGSFDAICTSPCYGNRLADSHNAQDGSVRRSYTHDLGRQLSTFNSGSLQWGTTYREFHLSAWAEAIRVLRPNGLFVLNVKDHIRNGHRQFVSGWHVTQLARLGLTLEQVIEMGTRSLRIGENRTARVDDEQIYVLRKSA